MPFSGRLPGGMGLLAGGKPPFVHSYFPPRATLLRSVAAHPSPRVTAQGIAGGITHVSVSARSDP